MNLNGKWKFSFDDQGKFRDPRDLKNWNREIRVPFAPESKLSGIHETGFHKNLWYQKEFKCEKSDGRILLHFGAVDYVARVWINDSFIGSHQGGHTPFEFDITDALHDDGNQTLTVHAEDDPHDLAKPRGKQDWQKDPHSIWYPRTSGIWQTVWLEKVSKSYIGRIRWTPYLQSWEIGCEAYIYGEHKSGLELKVKLSQGDQILASDSYQIIRDEVHRKIALSDPGIDDYRNELLWSPEKPTLLKAQVELWSGDQLLDQVESYTALRSVAIQKDQFMLNGRPYYLRLALDQGYWPESLMTAPSPEHLKKDVLLAKKMGFNGVRKHQKIEDPIFLYYADLLGLVVWEEMPSAYRFTNTSVERVIREWTEVIHRDSNHPCIVVWVPFNESWGVPDLAEKAAHQSCVQALYHLTRSLDPHRPVVG
jgi:beta-galactosidase/beta-glucuronidase